MRNACPQNTTAGILDLLCSFLSCPQSPERRKMCHCSQTNTFPVISKGLYWGTLRKDVVFTTFTPGFSSQSVSLSRFILSMQSQSELFIYSCGCSWLYKLAVITEWGARPLTQSSCTGALSCCSTERSPGGEGNDAVPGRRRDRGSNPWAKKQQLIFSTVQSAVWQPQLPNTA